MVPNRSSPPANLAKCVLLECTQLNPGALLKILFILLKAKLITWKYSSFIIFDTTVRFEQYLFSISSIYVKHFEASKIKIWIERIQKVTTCYAMLCYAMLCYATLKILS